MKRFELPPVGVFARMLPLVVGGLAPILLAAAIALGARPGPAPWREALPALLALPVVALVLAATLQGRVVELRDGRIHVRRWPVPRSFALADIDLAGARVVDFDAETALRPTLKLIGTRLPGLRSGWFMLRGRQRAYLLATTSPRAAFLPLRDGSVLLLGVTRPEQLLEALRDAAAAHR